MIFRDSEYSASNSWIPASTGMTTVGTYGIRAETIAFDILFQIPGRKSFTDYGAFV
jgi:hypothetical protein